MWNVSAWTYMSDIAEKKHKEGRVVGAYFSIAQIGQVISYFGIGMLLAMYSYMHVLLFISLFGAFGLFVSAAMFLHASKT